MKDGDAHDTITLLLIPVAAYIGALVAPLAGVLPIVGGVTAALGCALCWIVNPDLDQGTLTNAESNWRRVPIIGGVLCFLWQVIWSAYAVIIPHRSPLSHCPILGTAGRYIYLGAIVSFVSYVFKVDLQPNWPVIGLAFIGSCIGDLGHLIRDSF